MLIVSSWPNSLYYKIQSEFDSKDTWSAFGVIADGLVTGWLRSSWPNSLYYEIQTGFDSKDTWSACGVIADGLVVGWLSYYSRDIPGKSSSATGPKRLFGK